MSEIHGAVGSYVINALDADELDEFEAHLSVCPTCSREVAEFCETAAELSLLASLTAPPPSLRTSVLAAIRDVRPLPPELPAQPVVVPIGPRRAMVPSAAAAGPVDELAVRRQRRRTRILSMAVAAAMVVALALGASVFGLVQNRQAQVANATLESLLWSAPDVKVVTTTTKNGAHVSFVTSKSLNKAMFVGDNLPATGSNKRYQLWTTQGEQATADNQLEGGTQRQWFKGSLAGADGLAVTIEPTSGSTRPTPPILATATI